MRSLLATAALLALAAMVAPGAAAAIGSSADADEPPTFWNTLLFDSWKWVPGDAVAFGGVALWALLALVGACVGYQAPFRLTRDMAAAATLFIFTWSVVPLLGPLMEIGLPAAAGLALAWYVS